MDYVQRRIKIPKDIYKNVEKEAKAKKTSKHAVILSALEKRFTQR